MMEYKHAVFTDDIVEKELNALSAKGWQVHTYAPIAIQHGMIVCVLLIRIKVEPEREQGARNFIGKEEAMRLGG